MHAKRSTEIKTKKEQRSLNKNRPKLYFSFWSVRSLKLRVIVRNFLVCLFYFVAAVVARQLAIPPGNVVAIWPSTGIALSAVLAWGRLVYPGVFLGTFFGNFIFGVGISAFFSSALIATGECGTVFIAELLIRRFAYTEYPFEKVKSVSIFVGSVLIADLISACVGVTSLWAFNIISSEAYLNTWITWYTGDTTGMLLMTPLILSWKKATLRKLHLSKLSGFIVLTVMTGSLLQFILLTSIPLLYLIIPLFLLCTFLYGLSASMSLAATIALLSMIISGQKETLFPQHYLENSIILLQTFHAVIILTTLYFSALLTQLRASIELRDDFLLISSHELKTPITVLSLNFQFLRRSFERKIISTTAPDAVARTFIGAERQILRINYLIEDLLNVSRIRAEKLNLQLKNIDFSKLVADSTASYQQTIPKNYSLIHTHIDSQITLWGDPIKLEQVVFNLLSNAIKYGQGKPIEVRLNRTKKSAVLSIEDHGVGIPEKDKERIFERFVRVAPDQGIGGFGLGLFIVKGIVSAHRGSISVHSKPGEGSQFIVHLPLRRMIKGKGRAQNEPKAIL